MMNGIYLQEKINQMAEGLKNQGLRLTPQRLAVLKVLVSEDHHLTAEQIYQLVLADFPTTSLATIYKTLGVLIKTGLLVELGFSDDSNRYDLNTSAHAHLICVRCKSIIDPEVAGGDQVVQQIITKYGYQRIGQRHDIFGVCPQCQNLAVSS
jgi:Fur family transcriptional regulator, peroxide stress response regulator